MVHTDSEEFVKLSQFHKLPLLSHSPNDRSGTDCCCGGSLRRKSIRLPNNLTDERRDRETVWRAVSETMSFCGSAMGRPPTYD